MEALNEARDKMYAALEITEAVLKTGNTAAIKVAYDLQHEAILAYDAARNAAQEAGLIEKERR